MIDPVPQNAGEKQMKRRTFLFGGAALAGAFVAVPSAALMPAMAENMAVRETIEILATMTPQWQYCADTVMAGRHLAWYEIYEGAPNDIMIEKARAIASKAFAQMIK